MKKSILIVGGGVIGLCCAYYAHERGHDVILLERGASDHRGCSQGNAGYVSPSHFVPLSSPGMVGYGLRMLPDPESPFSIRPALDLNLIQWAYRFMRACNPRHVEKSAPLLRDLNLTSRACYEALDEKFGGEFGFTKRGLFNLCKTEEKLEHEIHLAEHGVRIGVEAEVLTPQQIAERDPNIAMDVLGGVYFPQDAHMVPQRFVALLTEYLVQNGVQINFETEVIDWKTNRRGIEGAVMRGGTLTAQEYVIAGGAWSPAIVRPLSLNLPLQAGKGYSMTLANPRQRPSIPAILTEARVAVTPMGSALRFAGTMEVTGTDLSINRNRVNGIIKSIPKYYPEFRPEDFAEEPVWSGLRPCSPDGLPYIGRTKRYPNLSIAAGHSMLGLSMGPISGRLIAEILSDETPSLEVSALSPERYD